MQNSLQKLYLQIPQTCNSNTAEYSFTVQVSHLIQFNYRCPVEYPMNKQKLQLAFTVTECIVCILEARLTNALISFHVCQLVVFYLDACLQVKATNYRSAQQVWTSLRENIVS